MQLLHVSCHSSLPGVDFRPLILTEVSFILESQFVLYLVEPFFLNIWKNEEKYKSIKVEILGEDSDNESESGWNDDDSEEEEGK